MRKEIYNIIAIGVFLVGALLIFNIPRAPTIHTNGLNGVETPDPIIECVKGVDFSIARWKECGKEGKTEAVITPISDVAKAGLCNISVVTKNCNPNEGVIKSLSLFGKAGFKTDVLNAYGQNNVNNINLSFSGKFSTIQLRFTVETRKIDGTLIQSPTSAVYFPMFRFGGGAEILSVLGTDRLSNGNIDNDSSTQPGIFRSVDTPKTLTFDMSKMTFAYGKTINRGLGHFIKDVVTIINSRKTDTIPMTLYILSDGKSLYNPDPEHRIDAVITEAYLEYECNKNTPNCSIKTE